MARSQYIYLIRSKCDGTLLGAFTVKHEAHHWVRRAERDVAGLELSRMPDGARDKTENRDSLGV